jgi:hypothetical protein
MLAAGEEELRGKEGWREGKGRKKKTRGREGSPKKESTVRGADSGKILGGAAKIYR